MGFMVINKVTIGLVLAMFSILLMHRNQPFIGLPMFILGIFLMMHKNKRK
jgi:hypothetical protein